MGENKGIGTCRFLLGDFHKVGVGVGGGRRKARAQKIFGGAASGWRGKGVWAALGFGTRQKVRFTSGRHKPVRPITGINVTNYT